MDNLKEVWEESASSWGQQSNDVTNYYTKRNDFVFDLIIRNIKPSSVLDVGCGAGVLCIKLHESSFEVYGVDISENMVCKTAERLSKNFIIDNINENFECAKMAEFHLIKFFNS